ncbi:YjbH domain-containing protein [Paracoccus suum]|uniref:YjbH domain-containing protein n=1 Tax=Paracoccus suum TaxID=2259340 RepID=A0A344PJV3_9RHOB|nr:YjbH domain-containing protein [Paracoccus suum]AXC49658.1 YjbH domain-containing protein [Paracoccus suum]
MPPAPVLRRLMASTLPAALLLASTGSVSVAQPATGWALNSYGLPGGIDTPSAEMFPDATISASAGQSSYGWRVTGAFQLTPRITTALRYSRIESKNLDAKRDFLKDRSADVRIQLLSEDAGWMPAVAVGLQDFIGTGTFSGEYVVATKHLTDRLTGSVGVGWGRLSGTARERDREDIGGTFKADNWFRGPARPFASMAWQATDNLRVVGEYSQDDYDVEAEQGEERPGSHFNLGVNYRYRDIYQLSAYTLGGKVFGAQVSFSMNPNQAAYPSGLEKAGAPVRPRPAPNADPEGWSGAWSSDPTAQPAIQQALAASLRKEGQILEAMALSANRAEVRIDNRRYMQQAEAIGRTARLMTRAMPPSVETFVITSTRRGMPTSSVVLRRSDIERLENTEAGQIAAVADIVNGDPRVAGMTQTPGLFPRFTWSLRPSLGTGLFDPDQGLRYDIGLEAKASYEIIPGLIASGSVRQRLLGNADQKAPGSCIQPDGSTADCTVDQFLDLTDGEQRARNNGVQRVRSDGRMYSGNTKPTIPSLTLAYYGKVTDTVYARVTGGLLERMYGGVSAEVLWYPADSNLALGAEINKVRKRDYEGKFGFQDYEVTTGHVSAYYDFQNGFVGQIDAGKYLAGDKGATVTLTREFANGWRVGAFATKTNMSAEDFGEGSFDKGITLQIPVAWATGQPSRQTVGGNINSLSRDGGQRVKVDGRLYGTVRDSSAAGLNQGWGKFWR